MPQADIAIYLEIGAKSLCRHVRRELGHGTLGASTKVVQLRGRVVIPPKAGHEDHFNFGRDMYCWRHLIENSFAELKEVLTIATRYGQDQHRLPRQHRSRHRCHRSG